jgi:hypothetical protein
VEAVRARAQGNLEEALGEQHVEGLQVLLCTSSWPVLLHRRESSVLAARTHLQPLSVHCMAAAVSQQLHALRLTAACAEPNPLLCHVSTTTQVYLCDDRLCYHQPDQTLTASMDAGSSSSPTASLRSKAAAAAAAAMAPANLEGNSSSASHLPLVGYYGSMGPDRQAAGAQHTAMSATAASLAALAAGEVRYIALDRIPVRPLPHRQHELGPFERSHPDVGVTLVDDG